ncbi:DUF5994 family protein [Streptomyces sp. B21-102]|uniref:DUF5994 family protein n=1 Tax=Streptomyces sp. B21-102 TaxID=3039416 RepID=UPI002FF01408
MKRRRARVRSRSASVLTCDEAPPHPVDGRIHMADSDHFALLVVPPDTTADAAREAMARAVRADNITEAAQILIATTPKPEEDQVVDRGVR